MSGFDIILIVSACVAALFVLCVLLYLAVLVRPRGKNPSNISLLCDYAHRGLHGGSVPENSLAAFERACEKGFGIELDIQLSRDGEVMVFHDYSLARMTGCDKKLCDLNASELSRLSLAGTNQTIPTFSRVLELVGGRVPILVELKGENLDTSLCKKAAELLKAYGGDYCIESFNPLLVRNIKKYLPDAFCGLLYTNVCREKRSRNILNVALTWMALNFIARPNFIAYNQYDRHSLPVRITTGLYKKTPRFVWTVRTEEELDTAHSLGECPIFEEKE